MTEQGFYDNLMVTNNQTGRNDVGVKCPEPVDRDVNNIQTELQNTITDTGNILRIKIEFAEEFSLFLCPQTNCCHFF